MELVFQELELLLHQLKVLVEADVVATRLLDSLVEVAEEVQVDPHANNLHYSLEVELAVVEMEVEPSLFSWPSEEGELLFG